MSIQVELINGSCVRITSRGFEDLLERRLVRGFMRNSGWVEVGVDPMRQPPPSAGYAGPERRRTTV